MGQEVERMMVRRIITVLLEVAAVRFESPGARGERLEASLR